MASISFSGVLLEQRTANRILSVLLFCEHCTWLHYRNFFSTIVAVIVFDAFVVIFIATSLFMKRSDKLSVNIA